MLYTSKYEWAARCLVIGFAVGAVLPLPSPSPSMHIVYGAIGGIFLAALAFAYGPDPPGDTPGGAD